MKFSVFQKLYKICSEEDIKKDKKSFNIHIAVFIEPFLTYLLNGKKQWESRFSINNCAPYKRVSKDDIIFIKKAGGPIVAIGEIEDVWFLKLNKNSFHELKENYSKLLCIEDPLFWEAKNLAEYATLIHLKNVKTINPIEIEKRDRRGWIVLKKNSNQIEMNFEG